MDTANSIHIANELLFEQVLDYLQQGKGVLIPIKGGSMRPFLKEGDKVLLKSIGPKFLSRGMIVLAKTNGKWLLHRIVRIDRTGISLAGDANVAIHEVVSHSDIRAVVSILKRDGREYNLNNKWMWCLGVAWYRTRPVRRFIRSCF